MTDRLALLVASGGHLLLLALLSLSLAQSLEPMAGPTDVTTVDLVELAAAAPAPARAPADPGAPSLPAEAPPVADPEPAAFEPAPAPEPPVRPMDDRSPQEALADQAAAPPPPRERPRRQPPPPAFDAGAIERLINEAQPGSAAGAQTSGAQRLDARTVASLEQAIRAQLRHCWNPPIGGADVANMTAVLRIRLNRDGSIAAPPELVSQTGATAGNAAFARAFVETARRAVLRCSPLTLPPELYSWWRDFELNFDPRLMT